MPPINNLYFGASGNHSGKPYNQILKKKQNPKTSGL